MDLDSMKYAELQRLAKEAGLKANMKADKLLKALKEHYQQQEGLAVIQEPENEDIGSHDNNNTDEPEPKAPVFVTKRRGKGHKTKRKRSGDAEAECGPELSDRPAEEAEPSIGSGGAKRRRLSEVENSGMAVAAEGSKETNPEAQPDHKDAVSVACEKGGEQKLVKAGKIPRHEGLLKRTKPMLRPTTPNFKKLHEAHFNKMESLDSYVQRRTKQVDMYRNSVKELKLLSEKTIMKPAAGDTQARSNLSRTSLFSPATVDKRPATDKRRHTQLSASKPTQKDNVSFRPTVLSTRRINVRFSQATQDNEHKRSLVKTPARLSTRVDLITPGKETNVAGKPDIKKTSAVLATKIPGTFVFNGNTSISNTPGTNTKPLFDLKASLSRPLAYKPHKGKLKPFAETKENTAESNSQTTQSHQMNYKQHQVPTREERRTKHTDGRKQKKEKMLGARRGLVLT